MRGNDKLKWLKNQKWGNYGKTEKIKGKWESEERKNETEEKKKRSW
jgi:hypothetical protein